MVVPCSQEEGDTRAFLHAQHMVSSGHVVIGLAMFQMISGLQELWFEFGTGNTKQYYLIHKLHPKLGADKAKAMIFFHTLNGCDPVSLFCSCRKTKAGNTWVNFPEVVETFKTLSSWPTKNCV